MLEVTVNRMAQLKDALQLLALPITAHVRLDAEDWGRVERFRKFFQEGRCLALCQLSGQFIPEQKAWL